MQTEMLPLVSALDWRAARRQDAAWALLLNDITGKSVKLLYRSQDVIEQIPAIQYFRYS
jgi:hypothetical protein